MRRSLWVVSALGALLASGCEHDMVKSDQTLLGRLPMEQKQPVFAAENNVQVAHANHQSALRAVDNAQTFRDVTDREVDSAKERVDASKKAIELGRKQGSPEAVQAARKNFDLSQRELAAFKAKREYADRLVDLRKQQELLTRKDIDVANYDVALARVETLHRAGLQPHQDTTSIVNKRDRRLGEIAGLRGRIAALEEQVGQLRVAWLQQRKSYSIAARGVEVPPIAPPAPPRQFKPEPLPGIGTPPPPPAGRE